MKLSPIYRASLGLNTINSSFHEVGAAHFHVSLNTAEHSPVELVNAVPPSLALKLPLLGIRYPR